ncbi:MAG: DNA repair protein RadA [Sandaracinaceae bacterium]|nr:DNA repair protein RadA [Sandaracinaceae bacterium]
MKKPKSVYACAECGAESLRWLGKCPACGAWSSLEERRARPAAPRVAPPASGGVRARPLDEVETDDAARRSTHLAELDRVLGGGAVAGGVVLLGGDPGIGKSTLLMQALAGLCRGDVRGLYASGEESAAQVASRARRLGVAHKNVLVVSTTDLEDVEAAIAAERPSVVVVDSVQTLRAATLDSVAGSVGQIRAVASRLIELAKRDGLTLFLIGHVTKEGTLAGPKVLEHLVDTVLAFEGDPSGAFRLVRTEKNRFGAAHEVGVFEMVEDGLREVPDPSALFLSERPERAAGSVVVPTAEGTRPLLVEVQALVAPAVYGAARRVSTGLDGKRLAILLAVLDRKAQVHVLDQDVFASVAGGARVDERAVDVALAIAVVSSLRERPVSPGLVAFGEVGLAGELRAVPRAALRLTEAQKLGFSRAILPATNLAALNGDAPRGIELVGVRSLEEALREAFG